MVTTRLDASAHATGSQQPQQPPNSGQQPKNKDHRLEWLKVADHLTKIESELTTISTEDLRQALRVAIRKLQAINAPTNPNIYIADTIKYRFKSLEKRIKTLIKGPKVPKAII